MALGIVSVLLAKTFRSSTFKLALISIGIFGVIVAALFSYVYLSTVSYVLSRSDHAIAAEQAILQKAYERAGRGGLVDMIEQRISDQLFADNLYFLADSSFAPIAGNLKVWPSPLKDAQGWRSFQVPEWKPDTRPTLRALIETLPNGDHLLVGTDIGDLGVFAGKIKTAFVLGIALIFVLAGLASISVTRRTVGRIETINATSRAIMESALDKRVPLRGTRDEWDQVAENLNLMLDRIETLMAEVKQATDNVAHDLRTPLTRMRGRLEKAYHTQRDNESDQLLIGDTMADLDSVLDIFSSLTRISQIEASAQKAAFRDVNLTDIASKVVELYDAAAEEKGIRLSLVGDQPVFVTGDKDLLFDAVANLVDNAIKYSGAAGQVIVENANDDCGAIISVIDDGPGIPVNEHANVFKRFYRAERSRHTPGNGLGLSLVAAVARLHGARIELLDNGPGLKIQICFRNPAKGADLDPKRTTNVRSQGDRRQ